MDFSINVDMVNNVIKAKMLIQKDMPNSKLNILFAIKNCMMHVANCTHKLVKAAPFASKMGLNMKLSVRLITTPVAATIFSCFKLPLAVSSVPNIYVIDIETKLPINICNISEDFDILIL